MDKHSRELQRYLKDIKKQTHMYNGSARFLDELKDGIHTYISMNPEISINDIYEKYGTPSELAKEFFQQVDMETYKRKIMLAKYVKRILFTCFILLVVLLLGLFINRQIKRPTTVEYKIETPSRGGLK